MKLFKALLSIYFSLILLLLPAANVHAQQNPDKPVYVVQSGDTLGVIALRFGISVTDLLAANNITDPNALSVGTELIIPGLTGIKGRLITETIPIGENMRSLSLRYRIPLETMVRLNRITSPMEVYAGSSFILPQQTDARPIKASATLAPEQSLLEVAIANQTSTWALQRTNQIDRSWNILPGETLFSENTDAQDISSISPYITHFELKTLPLVQGTTIVLAVTTRQPLELSGTLGDKTLHFFPTGSNQYAALQGIHALSEPGLSPFTLKGTLNGSSVFQFSQMLILQPGAYGKESLVVDPITIDPANTQPEEILVNEYTAPATPEKFWQGNFAYPLDDPMDCIRSWYGTRRTYNEGAYNSFHSGLDFGVCVDNLNVYASAPGSIIFAGPLTVRGNSVLIDHGWGVYTGYYHLAEMHVKAGDRVEKGQTIGLVGATGRVTGPHLHFEIWVNGVQVDPEPWFINTYP